MALRQIEVVVPYGEGMRLGQAYNDCINRARDWILMVDHDVWLATNPWWYEICLAAINKVGHNAGWITCRTNRIQADMQKAPNVPSGDDLNVHRDYARKLYNKNRGIVQNVTKIGKRFSGFFILTRRKICLSVGGFKTGTGLLHIDIDYYDKVKRAGFQMYLMADLYLYHGYHREFLGKSTFAKPEI
jgi:GT2 family glycosyltransferase